jgi:hypothetical protein
MKKELFNKSVVLLFDSLRGIYIPKKFVEDTSLREHFGLNNKNKINWGPCYDIDSDSYWEAWTWVLDNAKYYSSLGDYILIQNGDLWAVNLSKITYEEKKNLELVY